jgi:hypothetical protein
VSNLGFECGGSNIVFTDADAAMFYLPALMFDTFLSMLEAAMSSCELHRPRRKAGKPTVIILE